MPQLIVVMQSGHLVEIQFTSGDTYILPWIHSFTPDDADALASELKTAASKARHAAKFDAKTQKPSLF